MDALMPGQYLAEIRHAAEEAARRVDWSDASVVTAGGVCTSDADHHHTTARCKIPFYITFAGGTFRFWLTDRGGLECSTDSVADMRPHNRKVVLEALHQLGVVPVSI